MTLSEFIERVPLEGLRRTGDGYLARCPAHDDHHPSLSIAKGRDGRILLHCWAGCSTAAVLAALRVSWADLFPACSTARARR